MNYAVTLLFFLLFVQIQSAIIGGRTKWHGNEGLQDEESIQAKRILLGAGSAKHNVIVRSSRRSEISKTLCEQCRHSKLCELEGNCQHCSQFCKAIDEDSMRDNPSFDEELGIAREPETDIFRTEDHNDRTLVSRAGDDSVQMVDKPAGEENEQIDFQGIDGAVLQMAHNFNKDHQATSGKIDDGILESNNEESTKSQVSMRAGPVGDDKLSSHQESRYYLYGMINSGLLLNILSRLSRRKDHSHNRENNFDRAIILVKSSTPIHIEHDMMEKIGDSTFLRKLENELNIGEKNQHGKGPLTVTQIDKIIQIAHEKAKAISKKMESHIVGMEETVDGKSNNETVGCSKEEGETLPFFPIPPNLYRSGSAHQTEKHHHTVIVEPEELENSDGSFEKKQSKNPKVIQGNPNIESRSNTKKSNDELDVNHSIRTQIFDSISDELKTLENMNIVGSTKNEVVNEGRDVEEQKGSTEKREKVEQLSRVDEGLVDKNDSEEESVEENDETRTFHKKKKMNKKKGGYYAPSYGYGNSYGNHGQGYGHFYRHAHPDVVKIDSDEPHNKLDEQLGSAKYINENIEDKTNVGFNPNSLRTSHNHEDYKQKTEEHIETREENNNKPGTSRTEVHKQHDNFENLSHNQHDDIDQIIIPKTNMKLNRKKDLAASSGIDSPDELSNQLPSNLQDHSKKNHQNEQSTNEEHMEPPRRSLEMHDSSRSRITDGKTEVPSGSNNVENIVSSKHKHYKHRGEYYRKSDTPSSLEDEGIKPPNDSTHGIPNRKIMKERVIPNTPQISDKNKIDGEQLDHKVVEHHSGESIESNESSNHHSISHPSDNGLSDLEANEQSQISDKDKKEGIKKTIFNNSQHALSSNHPANNELVSQQQLQEDNDKMSTIDQNLPEEAIIQVDDLLLDVPKERSSMIEMHQKFQDSKQTNSDLVGEAPTGEDNSGQPGLSENIVGDQNMPLENLKVNPQIISDPSGQNLGFESDMNDEKPELSSNDMLPSKILPEIRKFNGISPAPAFGGNRKIEIDIPNFMTAMEQDIGNGERPSEIEPQTGTNEVKDSKSNQNQEVVGNTFTGNNNDINDENIDKLITPQEREFLHNFGKIVPAAEKLHLNSNTDVYFMGNGIKLPLKVAQDKDGSLALSVDLEKLCECKNATCSHKTQLLRELDNNMGQIFNEAEKSSNIDKREKSTNTEPATIDTRTKIASHQSDFSESNGYQEKNNRLHKRSINELPKKNNLYNNHIEIDENKRKLNSESEFQNSIVKESNDEEITDPGQLQDLHKFKKAEEQLEDRLEKLNEHVEKSSMHYNNMLQKSTKDLLQIKGEDQVVKQRVQLVNDLLKWMKEMAESKATFDKDNAAVYK